MTPEEKAEGQAALRELLVQHADDHELCDAINEALVMLDLYDRLPPEMFRGKRKVPAEVSAFLDVTDEHLGHVEALLHQRFPKTFRKPRYMVSR